MKKKSKKPSKKKTDNTHASLAILKQMILNLEQQIKELNTKVDQLRYFQPYIPKDNNPPSVTWPNNPQPYVVWCNNRSPSTQQLSGGIRECKAKFKNYNSDIGWDAIDKGLQ